MTRDLIAQLKLLKHDPRYGARDASFVRAERKRLMEAIGGSDSMEPARYTWRDYAEFVRYRYVPKMVRSFAGAAGAMAVMLGGWLTTVNAASSSLPGDALYGFKLAAEQAQLKLASLERRAVLHTEFAERRLHEAAALQQGVANDDAVRSAYTAFTKEVTSASATLNELRASGSGEAIQTAATVEEKLGQLDTMLDTTAAASDDIATEVQDAKDASREVQSTAVAVAVETHEEHDDDAGRQELDAMFKRELGGISTRQSFDEHRIAVLRGAMTTYADRLATADLPTAHDIEVIEQTVKQARDGIARAVEAFSSGNYRLAFDTLRSIDGELLLMESRLARAEITVTTTLSAPESEPESEPQDPAASDQQDITVTVPSDDTTDEDTPATEPEPVASPTDGE